MPMPSPRSISVTQAAAYCGCFAALLLAPACNERDAPAQPPPPPKYFSIPFESSFDEPVEDVRLKTWEWSRGMIAAGHLQWSLDSAAAYAGAHGMWTPPEGNHSGLMCGGDHNRNKQCFCGALLFTYKPVDLSTTSAAALTFMNRRRAVPTVTPPSCWSTYRCGGETTMGFNVLWLDESESPRLEQGHEWHRLATFSGSTGWREETVDLRDVIGMRIYLGFWQNDQCVDWDSTSASWMIDEVAIRP